MTPDEFDDDLDDFDEPPEWFETLLNAVDEQLPFTGDLTLQECAACDGPFRADNGYFNARVKDCRVCNGVGYLNVPIDAETWNSHRPGSEVRVAMMTARYAAGLDIWTGQPLGMRKDSL